MSNDLTGSNHLLLIDGQYYINAGLILILNDAAAVQEGGMMFLGFGLAQINAVGNNFTILSVQYAGGYPHKLSFRDIQFLYMSPQGSSNTQSICLGFQTTSGSGGQQIFDIDIRECIFENAFRAIANTQTSGGFTTWGIVIDHCRFNGNSDSDIYLVPPMADGQPRIAITNNYFNALNNGKNNSVHVAECDTLTFIGNEYNSLTNTIALWCESTYCSILRNKLEQCTYSTTLSSGILYLSNTYGTLSGWSFEAITLTANNYLFFVGGGNIGTDLIINDIEVYISSGTSTLTFITTDPQRALLQSNPIIYGLGSGPAVFRLLYSGGSTVSNYLVATNPLAGVLSDDLGAGFTANATAITGTGGQFSATSTTTSVGQFAVGQLITISGTPGGTGSITGYTSPTTYKISATNGTTTFTLVTTGNAAITTTAGTVTGLSFTTKQLNWSPLANPQSLLYSSANTTTNSIVNLTAANGSTLADNSPDGIPCVVICDATSTAVVDVLYTGGTKVVQPGYYAQFQHRRSKNGYIATGSGTL
jgi:hypothetical protein